MGTEAALAVVGHVLCTLLGMRAVLLLYRMGRMLLGDAEVAFYAGCVYCIQPASVFHLAPCVSCLLLSFFSCLFLSVF